MSVIRCLPIFILSTHSLKWETRKPSKAPSHKPKRFHIDVAFLTSELIKRYTRPFVGSIWKHVAKGLQMSNINGVDEILWVSISCFHVRNRDRCKKKWYTFQGPSPPNTLPMRFHVRNQDQCKKYIWNKYISRSFATKYFTHEISYDCKSYLKSRGVIDIPHTTSVPLPKISDNSDEPIWEKLHQAFRILPS